MQYFEPNPWIWRIKEAHIMARGFFKGSKAES